MERWINNFVVDLEDLEVEVELDVELVAGDGAHGRRTPFRASKTGGPCPVELVDGGAAPLAGSSHAVRGDGYGHGGGGGVVDVGVPASAGDALLPVGVLVAAERLRAPELPRAVAAGEERLEPRRRAPSAPPPTARGGGQRCSPPPPPPPGTETETGPAPPPELDVATMGDP
uniref:Uncharacterized protein n=1 Tax=Oryza brachyantha TaxID=4533 RepID=J3MIM6_ORYBR